MSTNNHQFSSVEIILSSNSAKVTMYALSNGERVAQQTILMKTKADAEALSHELVRKRSKLGLAWMTPNHLETLKVFEDKIVEIR